MAGGTDNGGQIRGYGFGKADVVLSVDDVARQARQLAQDRPDKAALAQLAGADPLVEIDELVAGYGKMEILHGIDLAVGAGQALCLIGPNGEIGRASCRERV